MYKKENTQQLLGILASLHSLSLKTQNYHWNVTGSNFHNLHKMFESQYNKLSAMIDDLAEHIRVYRIKIPANSEKFQKLSKMPEGNENYSSQEMLSDLLKDHKDMMQITEKYSQNIDKSITTINLLEEHLSIHEKIIYALSSSLEK